MQLALALSPAVGGCKIATGEHMERLPIKGETVDCPLRGETSIELCLFCPRIRGLDTDSGQIICQIESERPKARQRRGRKRRK